MKRIIVILIVFTTLITGYTLKATNPAAENKLNNQLHIIDSKTNQTITVTDKNKLQRFNYFWAQKQPITKTQTYHWQYQLMINDSNTKSKWVYDPKGFAREVTLNKKATIYQFSSARSLNHFLQGVQ